MVENRVTFTQKRVREFPQPTSGRAYFYDDRLAGFCVCVTAAGGRTWCLYKKLDGRPIRVKLGRVDQLGLDDARKAAAAAAVDIDKGIDPRRKRTKGTTLADLFDHWLAHAKQHKKTWREDERKFREYFGAISKREISKLATADVAKWHSKLGEDHGKYLANRARALLSAMYGLAPDLGFTGPNPCAGVRKFREESRERFLLPDEMRPFMEALKSEPPIWRDFWLACLFTGARRGNVAAMTWKDLDLGQGLWFVAGEKMKNGLPLAIVLPPPAVVVLEKRLGDRNGSPWVFPSDWGGEHVVDVRKSWGRVVTRAGLEDLRPHDLRRSLGSWQALAGASLQVIGQSLGHRDVKSTAVYSRLLMDPVRTSVNGATAAMLEAAEPKGKGTKRGKKEIA